MDVFETAQIDDDLSGNAGAGRIDPTSQDGKGKLVRLAKQDGERNVASSADNHNCKRLVFRQTVAMIDTRE